MHGWSWAAFVWGYALVSFAINDQVKLLTYRILDRCEGTTAGYKTAVYKEART